jgi:trimeric autotransporter adhesin
MLLVNTAGAGLVAVGAEGYGVFGLAGSSGGAGSPGVVGYGGEGQGVASGGDGMDASGGFGSNTSGAGMVAVGGAAASNAVGGDGVRAYGGTGGPGEVAGIGIYAIGGYVADVEYQSAAVLDGDVLVTGALSKAGGSFKIDDPLDPGNKYLYHSFVESPDMMNVYNGNVSTDASGNATVTLPDWFQALNRDFRYQLTVIGQFAQATVASEVSNNAFAIRTDKPNVKVSWQVTGIRQDAWANAHRIPGEVEKAQDDQGHYLHPELFGHAGEPNIPQMHHPRPQRQVPPRP